MKFIKLNKFYENYIENYNNTKSRRNLTPTLDLINCKKRYNITQ